MIKICKYNRGSNLSVPFGSDSVLNSHELDTCHGILVFVKLNPLMKINVLVKPIPKNNPITKHAFANKSKFNNIISMYQYMNVETNPFSAY